MSSKRKRTLRLVIGIPIALFLIIQLVPVWLLQTNPPVSAEPNWDSAQTRALAARACFNCHSNETVWPFYGRIAPVSWLVTVDVLEGRSALNFSEWNSGQSGMLQEAAGIIAEGEMPPMQYLLLHPEARLNASEKQQLITGLQASGR